MNVFLGAYYDETKTPIAVNTPYEHWFARRGLRGGRTDCLARKWVAKPGEYAVHGDVVSLYPSVQIDNEFPIGIPISFIYKPQLVNNENKEWLRKARNDGKTRLNFKQRYNPNRKYNGYIEVNGHWENKSVMFPALPTRYECNDSVKTVFSLLPVKNEVFTTMELEKAIQQGFVVDDVIQLQHYPCSAKIFGEFVKDFVRLKVEASKLPSNVDEIISRSLSKYDINIIKENIGFRPALRQVAKIVLNSLWGKFAQRNNFTSVEYINTESDNSINAFMKDTLAAAHGNLDISIPEKINDNLAWYTKANSKKAIMKKDKDLTKTNVALAGFVTAYARLKLLSALEPFGCQILLFDTDSFITIIRNQQDIAKLPEFIDVLGEWSLENKLTSFYGLRPKSYLEIFDNGNNDLKCKGVVNNLENQRLFNPETFKQLVTRQIPTIITNQMVFEWSNKKDAPMKTINRVKAITLPEEAEIKGKLVNDNYIVPFGFENDGSFDLENLCFNN